MSATAWAFDLVLAAGLVGLAWRTLVAPGLFRGIILYIAFGLLMALVWARLAAPDLALAEAAIGAGLTGALLLRTYRSLGAKRQRGFRALHRRRIAVITGFTAAALAAALGLILFHLPDPGATAGHRILDRLAAHPIDNPVTGVLLDFRAYDTLLEMGVLLLALVGARILIRDHRPAPEGGGEGMVLTLVRLLTPIIIVTAGYLLWSGTHATGGAFQAGAVLGGLGVLLILSGHLRTAPDFALPERALAALGLGLFTLAGLAVTVTGRTFLEWPEAWVYAIAVGIETALMISIGYTLALLFAAAPGLRRMPR